MKKIILSLLLILSGAMLIACGKKNEGNPSNGTTPSVTETPAPTKEAEEEKEGQAEEAGEDTEKVEERVIASSVAVVEILDALSIPMVGVPTSSYELPESVKDATRIGNPMSPDMEIISSLNPTVVVSVNTLSAELKEQFEKLDIASEFVDLSGLDGLKFSITALGERFGKAEGSNALIQSLEEKEQQTAGAIDGKEGPTVLIIFGVSGSYMVATENTYVGDLVKRAGGINVVEAEAGFIPVDMEFLADKNPEYILFMAHANPAESLAAFEKEFETNKAWQNFDAVTNGNTIALETGYFGMSANLLAGDALLKLTELLYKN